MRIAMLADAVTRMEGGGISGVNQLVLGNALAMQQRGHDVTLIAPEGTKLSYNITLVELPGALQPTTVDAPRDSYPTDIDGIIFSYCHYLATQQQEYDVILNCCQDLPVYALTPLLATPLVHIPNLGDENDVITAEIRKYAYRVGLMSRAQGADLGLAEDVPVVRAGIDVAAYDYNATPLAERHYLAFGARIAHEKGVLDAAEIAKRAGLPLHVFGRIEDKDDFDALMQRYEDYIVYRGFLDKAGFIAEMRNARALLCTHRWLEAFGMVVIEALACGTPVVTYDGGGPKESLNDGVTGFVVKAGEVDAAVVAVGKLPQLKPQDCRAAAEELFDLAVHGARLEKWIAETL